MGSVVGILAAVASVAVYLLSGPTGAPTHVNNPTADLSRDQMIQEARQKLGIDILRHYNFGIVGASGSGKSSLINAVRGLNDTDIEAAKVNEVECTADVSSYQYPHYPYVVLWDLPGAGTAKHPSATYFRDKTLFAFDCLLVVTSDRFSEIDLDIAKNAAIWGVPVVFVRNKIDQALASRKKDAPSGTSEQKLKDDLRADITTKIITQLQKIGLEDRKLYLVSSWAYLDTSITEMDEKSLVEDIIIMAYNRRNPQQAIKDV